MPALSTIQAKTVLSIVRNIAKEVDTNIVNDSILLDFINLSVSSVAEMLNGAALPDYWSETNLIIAQRQDGLYFTTLPPDIDRLIEVRCANPAISLSKASESQFRLYTLSSMTSWQNSVVWMQAGRSILFYNGASVSPGDWINNMSASYYRIPTPVTSGNSYLDIHNKYIPLVIDLTKSYVYEATSKPVPQSITDNIINATSAIRQYALDKASLIQAKNKRTESAPV
jgi:hypothetical protein